MKVIMYDTKPYDKEWFEKENRKYNYRIKYLDMKLNPDSAKLAEGYDVVCAFVNDDLGAETIDVLHRLGIKGIAMRCAGYNNVDLKAAAGKLPVVRVPAYSPHAVAEHTMAMLLAVNRKIHRAYIRTRDFNFSLNGLLGTDLYGKTVGVIGTGKIGQIFINICRGFGMHILAYDPYPNPDLDVEYVELDKLCINSDIISLHCPLTPETKHIINARTLALMKDHAFLLNTSRGALVESEALVEALKSKRIAGAALDVYEEESYYFFDDNSDKVVTDDQLARLLSFNNVIITSHQAFFTKEALEKIAQITFENFKQYEVGDGSLTNEIIYRSGR